MIQLLMILLMVSAGYAAYTENLISAEWYIMGLSCALYAAFMRILFAD